jgi:hypothetical protein
VVVDLSVGAWVLSLIEFQWRKGESACLGIVQGPDGSDLSDRQIAMVLAVLSMSEGNWASVAITLDETLKITGFRHTWESYKLGAERVLEHLAKDGFIQSPWPTRTLSRVSTSLEKHT